MNEQKADMSPGPLSLGHFDQNSPLSLYTKMGTRWAKKFMDKLGEIPECAEMLSDELVLKKHLESSYKFCPTGADHRYRLQLWLEYENSVRMNRPMQMTNVYALAGPESTFHHLIMKSAPRVVWMLCKPITYEMQTREMLSTGMARLRGYLDKEAFPEGGKPDYKLAKLQFDITRMMDMRQHGAPTQKIQSFEVKATMGANGELQDAIDKLDMNALQERKQKLEERRRASEGRAAAASGTALVVDVEVIESVKEGEDGLGNSG